MTKKTKITGAFVKTNGTRIWLDTRALLRGTFRPEEGSEQDQCEGCGHDLVETGEITSGITLTQGREPKVDPRAKVVVTCTDCFADFVVTFEA